MNQLQARRTLGVLALFTLAATGMGLTYQLVEFADRATRFILRTEQRVDYPSTVLLKVYLAACLVGIAVCLLSLAIRLTVWGVTTTHHLISQKLAKRA